MTDCIVQTPEVADALSPLDPADLHTVPGYPVVVDDPDWVDRIAGYLSDADVPWDEMEAARQPWQYWPLPVVIDPHLDAAGTANDYGRITIRPQWSSRRDTLLHELAHVYDFFCLTENDFRGDRDSSAQHKMLKAEASRTPDHDERWWSFRVGWANRWHEGFAEACKEAWGGSQARLIMTAKWDDITKLIGEVDVGRIAGQTRYDTAVEVSKVAHPDGCDRVALFRGVEPLYDAMAGAMLAAQGWAVLPTDPDGLPDVIAEEIGRLRPRTIRVLGGSFAVSDNVVDQAKKAAE